MTDSIQLDTENRNSDSSISIPVFRIQRMAFLKNDKIKFSVVVPPMYNIDNTNNNIILNNTTYSITNGFYESIDNVISEFNTALSATNISISLNNITGIISISHPTTNFTLTKNNLFGFTSNQSGAITYTATQCPQMNKNTISFCSNLSALFSQLNINKQQEVFHPKNYLFSFLNSAVNSYNYIQSDWMTVSNSIMFDDLVFFFGITGSPPITINDIKFNWSIIVDIQRN